jgi:hypothetical protein
VPAEEIWFLCRQANQGFILRIYLCFLLYSFILAEGRRLSCRNVFFSVLPGSRALLSGTVPYGRFIVPPTELPDPSAPGQCRHAKWQSLHIKTKSLSLNVFKALTDLLKTSRETTSIFAIETALEKFMRQQ